MVVFLRFVNICFSRLKIIFVLIFYFFHGSKRGIEHRHPMFRLFSSHHKFYLCMPHST